METQEFTVPNELLVATWNVRGRLGEAATQAHIFAVQADIFVLPEACAQGTKIAEQVCETFQDEGYRLYVTNYGDDDDRQDRHRLVVAERVSPRTQVTLLQLAGRTALKLALEDGTEIAAVHLDDRKEARRVAQTKELIRSLGNKAIVAGDLNTMPRRTALAHLLRMAAPLVDLLPAQDPVPGERTPKLKRFGSLSQRLAAMALGGSMELLRLASFSDAFANNHTPTLQKGPFKAQLDHILYRGDVRAVTPSRTQWVEGFDHAIVQTRLSLAV